MIADYFMNNECYNVTESSGAKMKRSQRVNYGDFAVGYVQLKRDGNICNVQGKVCPEHRVNSKAYVVKMLVNKNDEKVIVVQDCAASEGGCKHAIAFLMWVHRRSKEPEPTATLCYWKKPRLAKVSENVKNIKAKDVGKIKYPKDNLSNYDPDDFYNLLLMEFQSHQFDFQLSRHCIDLISYKPFSLQP